VLAKRGAQCRQLTNTGLLLLQLLTAATTQKK
jgi:hypothetical protein